MWSALMPKMKKGFKETDVIQFAWEEKMLKKLTLDENAKLLAEIEKVKAYYAKVDGKENKA